MASLVDLTSELTGDKIPWQGDTLDWHELAALWDRNHMLAAHEWLNERWSFIVRSRPGGHRDPDAQLLQGIAFAVNALHFAQNGNQEGALLMLDDALLMLARFRPSFLGVSVEPIIDTLQEIRPTIVALRPHDDFPGHIFVYRKFEIVESTPCLLS